MDRADDLNVGCEGQCRDWKWKPNVTYSEEVVTATICRLGGTLRNVDVILHTNEKLLKETI